MPEIVFFVSIIHHTILKNLKAVLLQVVDSNIVSLTHCFIQIVITAWIT